MAQYTLTGDGTTTVNTDAGRRYVWAAAGTWDGATLTLKWYDGTTAVTIQALTADGSYEFVAPTAVVQVVVSSAGTTSVITSIVPVLTELVR